MEQRFHPAFLYSEFRYAEARKLIRKIKKIRGKYVGIGKNISGN